MFSEKAMEKLGGLQESIRANFKPKKETRKQFFDRMEGRHDAYKQAKKAGRRRDEAMRKKTSNLVKSRMIGL